MSNSRHPVALELERRVGGSIRLLATVMALPLVDGIFPALILAGALDSTGGILQVGLLVFGGSATVAVVLAEMGENLRSQIPAIAALGVVLVAVAAVEAALAVAAATARITSAAKRSKTARSRTAPIVGASARIGEILPRPAVIVVLGLVASIDPAGATPSLSVESGLVVRGAAAAGVGAAFALLLALFAPVLRGLVDIDRFRFGSAVALGTLGLSLFDLVPGNAALAVLAVTAILAFDPGTDVAGVSGSTDRRFAGGGDADDEESDDGDDDGTGIASPERDPWM